MADELGPVDLELARLEKVIEDGLESFIQVGEALRQVRDLSLYRRKGYESFTDYCAGRWQITYRRAAQLMEASELVSELTCKILHVPPPQVESHATELARLPDIETQVAVWTEVVTETQAAQKKPTAKAVKEKVDQRVGKTTRTVVQKVKDTTADMLDRAGMNRDPKVVRARVMKDYTSARSQCRDRLLNLDPDAVADALPRDEYSATEQFLSDLREWCDNLDTAIHRPARVLQ